MVIVDKSGFNVDFGRRAYRVAAALGVAQANYRAKNLHLGDSSLSHNGE